MYTKVGRKKATFDLWLSLDFDRNLFPKNWLFIQSHTSKMFSSRKKEDNVNVLAIIFLF